VRRQAIGDITRLAGESMSMGMTRDELHTFLLHRGHLWTEKNLDAIMADYAPDIVYITPFGRIESLAQLRANNERYLREYTDISVDLTRLIIDGDQGALEWTWSETRVADAVRRSIDDAIVFVIRNRKIVYWREYFDTAAFNP
jgi:limonene-1,2-epoxide hydrolase